MSRSIMASSDSLDRLTVPQLKKILKSKGLPVSGNKALLQKRLKEADHEEQRRESIPSSTGVFQKLRRKDRIIK